MKTGTLVVVFLCLSLGLFLFLFVVPRPDSRIDLSERDYRIGHDVAPGWQRVCLFGQHEIPGAVERNYSGIPCEIDFEIPNETVVMAYFYKSKKCEILEFKGYFLAKDEAETRCFSPDDISNLKIQYKNEVINLEPK